MESVNFANSFNITLRMQLANPGRRIGALALDWLFMITYGTIVGLFVLTWLPAWFSTTFTVNTIITLCIVLALPIVFYHVLCETFFSGQTLGKMILQIKVTKEDGSPVTFGACLMRWALLLIDFWLSLPPYFGLIGLVSMASSKKNQRLGDRAAGTIVISSRMASNIRIYDKYYSFDKGYTQLYPQSAALSEAQVSFIISLLIASERKNAYNKDIIEIAGKVLNILHLDKKDLSGVGARAFLYRVVRDYNYSALNVA